VLVSSLGVPLPAMPVLLVSGSLAAVEGLNLELLFVLVTSCSVAGDSVDYLIGR
jgi:membrane-associated protein